MGDKELWGFINTKGKVAIKPIFKWVGVFRNGLCGAETDGDNSELVYINNEGKTISKNTMFFQVNSFYNGKAVVVDSSNCVQDTCYHSVVDKNINTIFNRNKLNYKYIEIDKNGYAVMNKENKIGWCDTNGKYIIKPQFKAANLFNDRKIAAVSIDGDKWGYINTTGKMIIKPMYNKVYDFNGNLGFVKLYNKIGAINDDGKLIINPSYDSLHQDAEYILSNNNNSAYYYAVESDYLDIKKIFNHINVYQPGNLSWLSPINNFLKLNKKKEGFSQHNHKTFVFKKI
jgi:hypothetical protein